MSKRFVFTDPQSIAKIIVTYMNGFLEKLNNLAEELEEFAIRSQLNLGEI